MCSAREPTPGRHINPQRPPAYAPVADGLGLRHDGVQFEQVVDGAPAAGSLRTLLGPVRGRRAVTRLQRTLT